MKKGIGSDSRKPPTHIRKPWFALALSLDKDDTIFPVSDKPYFCPDNNSFLYAVFLSLSSESKPIMCCHVGARKKSSFHVPYITYTVCKTPYRILLTLYRYIIIYLHWNQRIIAYHPIYSMSYATYNYMDNMFSDKCMMCACNSTCNTHLMCVFIAGCIQTCVTSVSCGIMITVHVWTCMLCADNLMVIKIWQSNTDPLSPEDVWLYTMPWDGVGYWCHLWLSSCSWAEHKRMHVHVAIEDFWNAAQI